MVTMNAQQSAVVSKYNLKVIQSNGAFQVSDEEIAKLYSFKDASKKGIYSGKTLDEALTAAVQVRKEHEESLTKNGNGNGKPKGRVLKANPAPAPTPAPTGKAKAKAAVAKGRVSSGRDPKPADTKPVVADTTPPAEIEGDDIELDQTGKRERNRKERVAKARGPNRYLRAGRIIVDQLTIDDKKLSKAAEMSVSTAGHCLDAWQGIVATLLEKNAFNNTWAKVLKDALQPKKEAAKSSRK